MNKRLRLTRAYLAKLLLGIISAQLAFAQTNLPLVRASSKTVDIRDGKHFRKGYWALMPERKSDYYYAEIPEKSHLVTFIADLDSITFNVVYGKQYEFVILLNGKDSCFTRIAASYKDFKVSAPKSVGTGPDTIPFTLGDTRKVYVEARLNGAKLTNVQLDLGAGGTVINKTAVNKVKINFDQKVTLANSDGVNQVPSASTNRLQVGSLVWDSVPIAIAENMKDHEDLIIGNSLFRGKILEINYDQKILVVHDELPTHLGSYTRHDMLLDGGVIPYVGVSLTIRDKKQRGWAMFDTGARTSILNSADTPMAYRLVSQLAGMIGLDESIGPKLSIGHYQLSGFEYKTGDMGAAGLHLILGNDLLKRFNLVFDNKNGYLYMQPNSLSHTPYGNNDEYYVVRVVTGMVLVLAGIVFYRKARKAK